jgi:hypothetical protein
MFIRACPAIGKLVKPLSGLVFHLGDTGPHAKPCEAAYLSTTVLDGVQAPSIRVFISPGSVQRATQLYSSLGGALTVEPLVFTDKELDAAAFLSLMAVGSSVSAPLYMQSVLVCPPLEYSISTVLTLTLRPFSASLAKSSPTRPS